MALQPGPPPLNGEKLSAERDLIEPTARRSGAPAGTPIRRTIQAITELLLPARCLGCKSPLLRGEDRLCSSCLTCLVEASRKPSCTRCGQDLPPFGGHTPRCAACRNDVWRTQGLVRVAAYDSAVGQWLRGFKFGGVDERLTLLADLLAEVIQKAPWRESIEILTYVPTCWQHQLFRRMHAATLLAPLVAAKAKLAWFPILRRIEGGPHQVGLSRSARIENVRGKFRLARGVKLRGARVCLVDDVTTTGATLNECTRVLLKGGAAEVFGAVVAKAGTPGPGA